MILREEIEEEKQGIEMVGKEKDKRPRRYPHQVEMKITRDARTTHLIWT